MAERLVCPTTVELETLRSAGPDKLKPSGLAEHTIARVLAGMQVQRSSLKLALQAAESARSAEVR